MKQCNDLKGERIKRSCNYWTCVPEVLYTYLGKRASIEPWTCKYTLIKEEKFLNNAELSHSDVICQRLIYGLVFDELGSFYPFPLITKILWEICQLGSG